MPGTTFFFLLYIRTGGFYFEWFLRTLFECYLAYMLIAFISSLFKKNLLCIALNFVAIGVFYIMKYKFTGSLADSIFSFGELAINYPFFVFVFLYCKFNLNEHVLKRNWIYSASLFIFVSSFFIFKYSSLIHLNGSRYWIALSAIIVCFKLAQNINYEKSNVIIRTFLKWGKISLSIYLISSMVVPRFYDVGELFIQTCRKGNLIQNFPIETISLQLVIGVAVSICICIVCAFIKKIISKSYILNFIFFGEKNHGN